MYNKLETQNKHIIRCLKLFIMSCFLLSACTDTNKYFDDSWKETTKNAAVYYRKPTKKVKGVWLINDYYISGEKQFVGQSLDSLGTIFVGDATWYLKTGRVYNKSRYKSGKEFGFFIVKDGADGNETIGWNEEDLHFIDDSKVVSAANAVSTSTNSYDYYYKDTAILARRHTSMVGFNDKNSFTLFFSKNGDTIGRMAYNKHSKKWQGKDVIFYEVDTPGRDDVISVKEIHNYDNGVKTHIEFYSLKEQLIAEVTLKDNTPFNGTTFKKTCNYTTLQNYKNGSLSTQITYTNDGEILGQLEYKNNVPHTGTLYYCNGFNTYKNGKKHGKCIQYVDDNFNDIEFEFRYKNGVKHGPYSIYQNGIHLLETGMYKNGVQVNDVIYHQDKRVAFNNNEKPYYLKTQVKQKNNTAYIDNIKQYSLFDNKLLNVFDIEPNNTDQFTYLNNGYHSLSEKDINSDGFNDLQIKFYHHLDYYQTHTYYLFNSLTQTYTHIPQLDDVFPIKIDASNKVINVTFQEEFNESFKQITYGFSKNNLIKQLEVEEVYHQKTDTLMSRQVYPLNIDDYPNNPPSSHTILRRKILGNFIP